ncbi:MAG: SIS domain-containing protein [Brevinema sp.]
MKESMRQSIQETLKIEGEALLGLMETLDETALEQVISAITSCKGKIITSGCGTSSEAAKKIAHTLSCIECPALFLSPSDAAHGRIGVIQKDDVVILISKGGETEEIVKIIPIIKTKKAFLIGITEKTECYLAKQSDVCLQIKVEREADVFNMLATASIVALIAVFDAITIAIMKEKSYSKEEFALIHPSGAVGVKLKAQIQK